MSSIRAVVVDLGGVLFLPPSGDLTTWISDRLSVPASTVRASLWHAADVEAANIGQLTAEEYAARAAHRLGVPAARMVATLESVFAGTLNEPLADYLRRLPRSVKVAALTNNWSFLGRLLAHHGLSDLFDVVVNSADVGCCKPHPTIFQALLDRVACRAEEVVFVDDNAANVRAAASLGLKAMHFESTEAVVATLGDLLPSDPRAEHGG